MSVPRIAIIGGGFSGCMLATHLLGSLPTPSVLYLIERRGRLGRGVAYGTPFEVHVLNVPAGKMSAFPDKPNHFVEWLAANGHIADSTSFAPRPLYGEYIESVMRDAVSHADPGIAFVRMATEATSLSRVGKEFVIDTAAGRKIIADTVVLALGNFPPANPVEISDEVWNSGRYSPDPWGDNGLESASPNEDFVLFGSGLTSVDLALAIDSLGGDGKITMISRRGLMPQEHAPCEPWTGPLPIGEWPSTAEGYLNGFRLFAKKTSDWRAAIDAMRPHTQALWQRLPEAEKRKFLRWVRPFWEVHRHRMSPAVASKLRSMVESGKVRLLKGSIRSIANVGEQLEVKYQNGGQPHTIRAHRVINCTGSEANFRRIEHPLTLGLLSSGLAQPDPLGMGFVCDDDGILAGTAPTGTLLAIGPLRKSRLYESTAVPELRVQAEALAKKIVAGL